MSKKALLLLLILFGLTTIFSVGVSLWSFTLKVENDKRIKESEEALNACQAENMSLQIDLEDLRNQIDTTPVTE